MPKKRKSRKPECKFKIGDKVVWDQYLFDRGPYTITDLEEDRGDIIAELNKGKEYADCNELISIKESQKRLF